MPLRLYTVKSGAGERPSSGSSLLEGEGDGLTLPEGDELGLDPPLEGEGEAEGEEEGEEEADGLAPPEGDELGLDPPLEGEGDVEAGAEGEAEAGDSEPAPADSEGRAADSEGREDDSSVPSPSSIEFVPEREAWGSKTKPLSEAEGAFFSALYVNELPTITRIRMAAHIAAFSILFIVVTSYMSSPTSLLISPSAVRMPTIIKKTPAIRLMV